MTKCQFTTLLALVLLLATPAAWAQDTGPVDTGGSDIPEIPALEEVQAGARITDFIPMDYSFRIGVVGEFLMDLETTTGITQQVKTPLILINPSNAEIGVFAKNFPARIIANSPNGNWIIGIAPSYAVEGSSGSSDRECAVSLNLAKGGIIHLIKEFPLHSNFQAVFDPDDNNAIYYCVNQPAEFNQITRFNLESDEKSTVRADGNRFYILGLIAEPEPAVWVIDPLNTKDYPVIKLIGLDRGTVLDKVEFPGASEIIANHSGDELLVVVKDGTQASLGLFNLASRSFSQVPSLVFNQPDIKWSYVSNSVLVKETSMTQDRFVWVDLDTAVPRELFSAYFKVDAWDIAQGDEALVFVTSSKEDPVLFVIPLNPSETTVNRIKLKDVDNVTWIGCLTPPPSRGSWWNKLIPFKA